MYRRTNKTQKNYRKSYNKVNVASAQWEQSDTAVQRIPELRRVIEITDYDKGVPTTHRLELYKTNRIGWSNILAGIRKALPRLARE